MSQRWTIAVLGASGLVGETLLTVLEERNFPVQELFPLASERSLGKTVQFNGRALPVLDAATFDFARAQLGLFSAGGEVSALYAPKATAAGCVVIDNTSQFRYQADIPLVVPEVNPAAIAQFAARRIIANPNCSTIQMVVALKPIYDAVGIERINVATYQAVSGAGRRALEELAEQSAQLLNGRPIVPKVLPKQIAFNCVPQVDKFMDNGYTKEEMKMHWETQKIFADEHIRVNATAVRVPVFFGHSEALHIETRRRISAQEARALLSRAPRGWRCWTSMNRVAIRPQLPKQRTTTRFMSGASARICPMSAVLIFGSWVTTSARARPPTQSRSPRFWFGSIYKLYCRAYSRWAKESSATGCFLMG